MEEEEEMMDEGGDDFASEELDLDYEFSAPHLYDFTKVETTQQSEEAEAWFDIAAGYPPSPYLANLHIRADLLEVHMVEHDDISHDFTGLDSYLTMTSEEKSGTSEEKSEQPQEIGVREPFADVQVDSLQRSQNVLKSTNLKLFTGDCNVKSDFKEEELSKGLVCDNCDMPALPRSLQISLSCVPFTRNSTLMKPTASQLAKQKMPISKFPNDVNGSSKITRRVESVLLMKHHKDAEKTSLNECHASKRQKLDGGHLRKVQQFNDMKQSAPLVHKEPKRVPIRGNNSCCSLVSSKCVLSVKDRRILAIHEQNALKLTVPREPALETSQRARTKANIAPDADQLVAAKAPLFKARPLNRKILETPSLPLPQRSHLRMPKFQEFHLKTSERALQHSIATSVPLSCIDSYNSSNISPNDARIVPSDTKTSQHLATKSSYPKSKGLDAAKLDDREDAHVFKARPLNKKIFSSKGDLGIYRNLKRETTKPMGFNFSTDKRFHQSNPPTELFGKLSLKSDVQPNYASQIYKEAKENMKDLLHPDHMVGLCVDEEKHLAFQNYVNLAIVNEVEVLTGPQDPPVADKQFPVRLRILGYG